MGTAEDNVINAFGGDDTVAGELGNDLIYGGDGDDVLRGDRNNRSPGGAILSKVVTIRAITASLLSAIALNIPKADAAPLTPTPLIIDDDGSQDGMTALAYMLQNPKFDIQAITISQGIADPPNFVNNLERMLGRLGVIGIPVGVGQSDPLIGNNAFPSFIRDEAVTFWSPFIQFAGKTPTRALRGSYRAGRRVPPTV